MMQGTCRGDGDEYLDECLGKYLGKILSHRHTYRGPLFFSLKNDEQTETPLDASGTV